MIGSTIRLSSNNSHQPHSPTPSIINLKTFGSQEKLDSDDIVYPIGTEAIDVQVYKGEIIEETYGTVGEEYKNQVIYKEVPVYITNTREIIKKEYIVEKKIVKKPVIKYVDTHVAKNIIREVEVIEEVPVKKTITKHVPIIKKEEKIVNKTRYVPVDEIVEIERIVEVPGEVIETHRIVPIEREIYTDSFVDIETPLVVSQIVQPVLSDSGKTVKVAAKILAPNVTSAVANMPKPIEVDPILTKVKTIYRPVALTNEQYNSILRESNKDAKPEIRDAIKYRLDTHTGAAHFPVIPTPFTKLGEGYYKAGNVYKHLDEDSSFTSSSASEETKKTATLVHVKGATVKKHDSHVSTPYLKESKLASSKLSVTKTITKTTTSPSVSKSHSHTVVVKKPTVVDTQKKRRRVRRQKVETHGSIISV